MLVYSQNGERVRPAQGYPLRILLPGFEGNMNVKWLRRLHVTNEPIYSREETSKYTDLMPDGKARKFTFMMEAKSIITRQDSAWVQRNHGPGVDGAWQGCESRRVDGRRQDLASGEIAGARSHAGVHAIQASMDLGREARDDHQPRDGRDRLRTAELRAAQGRPRSERPVPQQRDLALEDR